MESALNLYRMSKFAGAIVVFCTFALCSCGGPVVTLDSVGTPHSLESPLATEEVSFLPTWKLLNSEQKQQFVAGYMHGWRDAARVTQIAAEFVKDNPGQAHETLEHIQGLYTMSKSSPRSFVAAMDLYFADPANSDSSLSMAVSAAKSALRGHG